MSPATELKPIQRLSPPDTERHPASPSAGTEPERQAMAALAKLADFAPPQPPVVAVRTEESLLRDIKRLAALMAQRKADHEAEHKAYVKQKGLDTAALGALKKDLVGLLVPIGKALAKPTPKPKGVRK